MDDNHDILCYSCGGFQAWHIRGSVGDGSSLLSTERSVGTSWLLLGMSIGAGSEGSNFLPVGSALRVFLGLMRRE